MKETITHSPTTPAPAGQWPDALYRRLVDEVQDYAIFFLDHAGQVSSWNRGAELLKGYSAPEILGKHFSIFYPRAAVEAGWPAHELESAERLGRFEDEGWRVRQDGTRFWASVIITAMRDDDGVLIGFSKITRDLTERRSYEERLRLSEERFRLLLEGVSDYAIYMLDTEGRVTSWNTGAERITGYTASEIIGQSFERFYPAEDVAAGRPAAELREAVLHRRAEDLGWRVKKSGTRFWAEVVVTALHDHDGNLIGFAKVTRDLSDQKHMEQLEEEGRHLTEFLAMLAHELRNPLAPIRNSLAILAMTADLPPKVAWARDVMDRQAAQLSRLVDDLLDVSRITRGKLRLQSGVMDMREAVDRAVESARPEIDARGHAFELTVPDEAVPVQGDLTRLTQVVLNLLNNAAKYTPQGGRIALTLGVERGEATLRVCDSGVGIAPGMIEHVFDLFAQGERTIDRSEGGLGIGLTLARRIVVLHGGSIAARSDGVGMGSEFEVRMPILTRETEALATSAAAPQSFPVDGPRRRVLVVDDNSDAASSTAMLLRMAGHEVGIEPDGRSALARVARDPFDIVLLDIGLPGIDGFEVARRLRAQPGLEDLRIVATTGYGHEEDRRRSLEAGFDGHLVKPVMPGDLFATIARVADGPRHAVRGPGAVL